jgi:hypothetical protein
MAAYQGTLYSQKFRAVRASDGTPVDLTGWQLKSEFRTQVASVEVLFTATTENGGWVITEPTAGVFTLNIAPEQTAPLPVGAVVFDVLRTDPANGPVYWFAAKLKVKQPVTR